MMSKLSLRSLLAAITLSVGLAMPDSYLFPPPADEDYSGDGRMYNWDGNSTGPGLPPPEEMEALCAMLTATAPTPAHIPWFCLCTQCKGSPGPKGDRGDRGLPGMPGSPGRRGMMGIRGPPGFTGNQGIKGQKGDYGEKGNQGQLGGTGSKGARGFKGEKGDMGLQGPAGELGPKGDDGTCPEICDAVVGEPGSPGLPGPAGPRGLPGVEGPRGPKGLKGDPGVSGVPGTTGPMGEKGDQGPQGDCNCTDGRPGSRGPAGEKGEKGAEGLTGSTGRAGAQGQKGDIGPMGMMGMPGPCMPAVQSAFAAELMEDFPQPLTPIIFGKVLHNTNGNYNPETGVYTAPVNGTYLIQYHVSVAERPLKIGIFHNFIPVIRTTSSRDVGTTSHSIILHLSTGDLVWILAKDTFTNGMIGRVEATSTFSGMLIFPDSCDIDMAMGRGFPPVSVPPEGEYSWGP